MKTGEPAVCLGATVDSTCTIHTLASTEYVVVQLGRVRDKSVELCFTDDSVDALIAAAISGRDKMLAKRQERSESEGKPPESVD